MDSNHRSETQQIYSLPPLATRELLHIKLWSWWTDSNPRPADYKSAALPAELHQQTSAAVQQQVVVYQRKGELSSIFPKNFLPPLALFAAGRSLPWGNGQHGLLLPLGDRQDLPPAWYCPLCGGEQYSGDLGLPWHGQMICPTCLARLEEEEE